MCVRASSKRPIAAVADAADVIRRAFAATCALHEQVVRERSGEIAAAAAALRRTLVDRRRVLVFGNGGSATDAQHFAGELVGRFLRERRAAPVIALTSDSAVMTAIANDSSYDVVFARQVEALGNPGDIAFGITTSGGSKSVNLALARAREQGLTTMALTGRDGGETGRLADIHVNVPSADTPRVQEVQRTILHVMCALIEEAL